MEEVITYKAFAYKAFDGTTFTSKAECIRYEENLNESLKLKKEIKSYLNKNSNSILSFLILARSYCKTFSWVGDCKGCLFAKDDQDCVISDMPEDFDIEELKNIIERCNKK